MTRSSGSPADHVHLNLMENGLDFLLSAVEAVRRDESPRSLKDAVLHVANGTELLFKSRLAEEHWTLIFASPDEASHEKLAGEDFRSVDFKKAVERLDKIAKVQLDMDTAAHLNNLRKVRNRLTHFTAGLEPAQTKSLVAKSMALCITFCEDQGMLPEESESKLGEIHQNLSELQEFVDERMGTILREWSGALIWECPQCWQMALVIDGGEVHCKFCLQEADPRKLAESNSESSAEDYPECWGESTFALVLHGSDIGTWICFSCGVNDKNYDHCFRCDQMTQTPELGEVVFCENCSDHFRSE